MRSLRTELVVAAATLKGSRYLLIAWSIVAGMSATAAAQAPITDDAHTNGATPANFGTNPNLTASSAGPVYLRFDPLATLADGTPGSAVERAVMTLFVGNVTGAGALDVYAVAAPWSERTITGADAPPLGPLMGISAPIGNDRRNTFITIDVTTLVQQWLGADGHGLNGLPNYGLALVAGPGTHVTFDSKENSQTGHEPQLTITLLRTTTGGGGGVQSVTADMPIAVTGSPTAPHLSLGLISASFGGTGLGSPGAAGNFLRSAGGIWTSAPLSDTDIPDLGTRFIKNGTASQASANFNISGKGDAQTFDAAAQFNLGGRRILGGSAANFNLFAGTNAGSNGSLNAFFGSYAGEANNTGAGNAFFGAFAGRANTQGTQNSFFGPYAGMNNTVGYDNAFFGVSAGQFNETGVFNSFFGSSAGIMNRAGYQNAFFGQSAGFQNTTGSLNAFFGSNAGGNNDTGSHLTVVGAFANVGAGNLAYATAIGSGAFVTTSNTVVLGRNLDTVHVPGTLSVSAFNVNTQYNLGGNRVLTVTGPPGFPNANLIAGVGAGAAVGNDGTVLNSFFGYNAGANTIGGSNAFFGATAGAANTAGGGNSFFGASAGSSITATGNNSFFGYSAGSLAGSSNSGSQNSFFGSFAGASNTTGTTNDFFGFGAGVSNTSGLLNVFVGSYSGYSNTTANFNTIVGGLAGVNSTGAENAFFGSFAGDFNTTGSQNAFFGSATGADNISGLNNTFIGAGADFTGFNNAGHNNTLLGARGRVVPGISNATAIGYRAMVTAHDSLVLGGISGVNGGTDTNVGIGTTAPNARLEVTGGDILVGSPGQGIILKSPDAAQCRLLSIDNSGSLVITPTACP